MEQVTWHGMAGSVNGTAALITADYLLALYLHCTAHCLNLAVVRLLQANSKSHSPEGLAPLTSKYRGIILKNGLKHCAVTYIILFTSLKILNVSHSQLLVLRFESC